MSLATEEAKRNDKMPAWLPLGWGARFAIAVTGTAVLWWWITSWMRSKEIWTAYTAWDGFWMLSKLVVVPLLFLLFLIWTVKLL